MGDNLKRLLLPRNPILKSNVHSLDHKHTRLIFKLKDCTLAMIVNLARLDVQSIKEIINFFLCRSFFVDQS